MRDLRDFKVWYEGYQEAQLPPSSNNPYYVPQNDVFGNAIRGMVNFYDKIKGNEPRNWDAASQKNDLARQQRSYQHAADQRQQNARFAAGDPNDPIVRAKKATYLAGPLKQSLERSLVNTPSNRDVNKALDFVADQMSQMICGVMPKANNVMQQGVDTEISNQGRPIISDPIMRAMSLVHSDPNIPEKVKQVTWETPLEVMRDVVLPVVKATPQSWYDSNAVWPKGVFPPGTMIDMEDFQQASEKWLRMGAGQKSYGQKEIEQELIKNRVKPNTLSAQDLGNAIDDIVNDLTQQGHSLTKFGDADKQAIIKAYAKAEQQANPYDVLDHVLTIAIHTNQQRQKDGDPLLDITLRSLYKSAEVLCKRNGETFNVMPAELMHWASKRGIAV